MMSVSVFGLVDSGCIHGCMVPVAHGVSQGFGFNSFPAIASSASCTGAGRTSRGCRSPTGARWKGEGSRAAGVMPVVLVMMIKMMLPVRSFGLGEGRQGSHKRNT